MTNLYLLNDDCWLYILKFVSFRDQLQLAKVSKQLYENVIRHWRGLKKASVTWDELNSCLVHEFMECSSKSLQELVLIGANGTELRSLQAYSFPNLRTLDFVSKPLREGYFLKECPLSLEYANENMLLLTLLFPFLTKLTLRIEMEVSGTHMWRWSQLQELHLYLNPSVSLFQRLLLLPKLVKLTLPIRDLKQNIYSLCLVTRPLRVKSLVFNAKKFPGLPFSIESFRNLQKLVFYRKGIKTQFLLSVWENLPQLEELHFIEMNRDYWTSAMQIWELVAASSNRLKLLNLSGNQFDAQMFVEQSVGVLGQVLGARASPLTVCLDNTSLEALGQKIHSALWHPNLKISFESIELQICCKEFMEIELTPYDPE